MSQLLTSNPIAIRILMSETIFSSPIINELIDTSIPESTIRKSFLTKNDVSDLLFWGSNERGVMFLLRNPVLDYFSDDARDAFLKTLAALKLTIDDITVVNFAKTEKTFNEIKEALNPKFCIYCEGENEDNRNFFNMLFEKDGLTLLYTYSFEEMLTDVNKKRAFWNAIKEINVV